MSGVQTYTCPRSCLTGRGVYPYRAQIRPQLFLRHFRVPLLCCAWIFALRSHKPADRAGRGAAVLVSFVVVSAAVLTALANVIEGGTIRTRDSPRSRQEGGGRGEQPPLEKIPPAIVRPTTSHQETGGRGEHPSSETPPPSQGSNVTSKEVVNGGTTDAPASDAAAGHGSAGDENGQGALLLAVGSLPSIRSPSSTLVWLMVVQAQFLAVLSLVDSAGSDESWLSNFLKYLR